MAENMPFVPWQHVADWKCVACGLCCRIYSVVLSFPEWFNIVKNYGIGKTRPGLDKLFLGRRGDGSCVFLQQISNNTYLCGIQSMKPKACKLWPFKVLSKPKFGRGSEAVYQCAGNRLYVYLDSNCRGMRYGIPNREFISETLEELVEIALSLHHK